MKRILPIFLVAVLLVTLAPSSAASEKKRIALTFDDGPHPENTDAILSLLDEYHIPATFFVIGENIAYFPEVFGRLAASGHEIGNHTYTHPKLKEQSAPALHDEILRCENEILSHGGKKPTLFRPPEGVKNEIVTGVSRKAGYRTVYWTLDTRDWTGASAASIERAILSGVKRDSIILCHDYIVGGGHTVEALGRVIPKLLSEGYEFVSVSELLGAAS